MSSSVFKLTARVRIQEDGDAGGGVLFDSHTAAISTCNDSALDVLKALKKGADVETLSKRLSERYDVGQKEARADVVALLKELTTLEFVCEQK